MSSGASTTRTSTATTTTPSPSAIASGQASVDSAELSLHNAENTLAATRLYAPASGTIVRYTQPGGAGPWVVASSEGALSSKTGEKETFEWERLEGLTRPKEAFAPAPAGVSCSSKVERGCRALKFVYATATTATGEAPSQWGPSA